MILKPSPFFSVIIPTLNRKSFLDIALMSVFQQTYENFEVIVIDDGSSDHTEENIARYDQSRIVYQYQDHHGVAHARNRGCEMARGDFIAFLDSDDHWVPQKLEKTLESIRNYSHISIFHTDELWYRNGELLNPKKKHKKPTGFVYKNALPLCCISLSTAVLKRDVFKTVGLFDEEFPICEDYDFWLRATSQYEVKLIPEYLTLKDGGRSDQLTSNVWGLDRYRIKAMVKMIKSGLLESDEFQCTLKEIKKKCHVYIEGAQKRGKVKEVNYYRELVDQMQNLKPEPVARFKRNKAALKNKFDG